MRSLHLCSVSIREYESAVKNPRLVMKTNVSSKHQSGMSTMEKAKAANE
jgi:hypothetical protein